MKQVRSRFLLVIGILIGWNCVGPEDPIDGEYG